MNKYEIISKTRILLNSAGFDDMEYTISLQGPTVIMHEDMQEKLTDELRKEILKTGMKFL
jgi:chlorite dismutase